MPKADPLQLGAQLHRVIARRRALQPAVIIGPVEARQRAHLTHPQFALQLHQRLDLGEDAALELALLSGRSSSMLCKAPLKKRFSSVRRPTSASNSLIHSAPSRATPARPAAGPAAAWNGCPLPGKPRPASTASFHAYRNLRRTPNSTASALTRSPARIRSTARTLNSGL